MNTGRFTCRRNTSELVAQDEDLDLCALVRTIVTGTKGEQTTEQQVEE